MPLVLVHHDGANASQICHSYQMHRISGAPDFVLLPTIVGILTLESSFVAHCLRYPYFFWFF
jgi:hypothetical protein